MSSDKSVARQSNLLVAKGGASEEWCPACLLSDCDGVILDSEHVAEVVMVAVLRDHFPGTDVEGVLAGSFGMRVTEILRHVERSFGVPLDDLVRVHLLNEIDRRTVEGAVPMYQVREVYSSLEVPIAVVSNSSPSRLRASLNKAGLSSRIGDFVFSGDEVARPKPAPDVYLKASQALGIAPEQCLVVEDSVTGVRAARAAGMKVVGFIGGSHIEHGHSDSLMAAGAMAVLSNLAELNPYFRR